MNHRDATHIFFYLILLSCQMALNAWAEPRLSEVAFFHRCYSQLTQLRAKRNDPLVAQVRSGAKTALQACTEVLDKARFTADNGTKIGDVNDPVARAVLYSLHQLHSSWSRQEDGVFDPGNSRSLLGTESWYEDYPLGAYITRALFSPNFDVVSVISGNDYPQPVRAIMDPPHSYRGVPSAATTTKRGQDFTLGAEHPFAPLGELYGIRSVRRDPLYVTPSTRFVTSTIPDFANIGVPPKATQNLSNIDLPDLTAVRGPLSETDLFAIRIKGKLIIATPGSYRLYLNVDDAAVFFLDGEKLFERPSIGEGFSPSFAPLSVGSHDIEIRYRQASSAAKIIMSWQGDKFPKQVVPASAFTDLQAEYYTESRLAPQKFTGNEGGGFIGNHNYLLTSFIDASRSFVPNGAERVNRSWARAVLKDAFCRDVPVVRESDVEQFVILNSTVPFRQTAACNSCHATLDRQAGVIRGLRYNDVASREQTDPSMVYYGLFGVNLIAPSYPAVATWSDIPDPLYPMRPPDGRLYFRNFRGELINRAVHSIEELGAAISEQDDFYLCFAKRYYQYFLGIRVEIDDPGSTTYPQLNGPDSYHQSKVIDLGLRLKNHKSLRQLILDIMGTEEYRRSDFGISSKGANP